LAKVKIRRYKPGSSKGYVETFEVPLKPGMSVLGVLAYVRENLDSSLAYYVSCRHGRCTPGCTVTVNGQARLACLTAAKGDMTLEPVKGYAVVRDLLVDYDKKAKSTSK